MVSAGTAVVATVAVGGTALGIYGYGLSRGWWFLPSWLGGPTAQEIAAAKQQAAAAARARQGERAPPFGSNSQGYTGHQVGGPTLGANRGDGRYAYLPSTPLRADQAGSRSDSYGSGLTTQANQSVLRRLFTAQ